MAKEKKKEDQNEDEGLTASGPGEELITDGVEKYIPGTKIIAREYRARFPDKLKKDE